ncbi:twin-arginine translocation pathway signal [Mycobacterium sp. AMU20-3851]|uniref:twin-arginine translocation pathway signal n=1 Tax=Mycobacterium sp. AMU20-3851 TaxID=3122055 RepID=UPI003754040F
MTVDNDTEVDAPIDTEIDSGAAAAPDRPAPGGPVRTLLRGAARFWAAIVLVLALAVTGGLTAWLYVNQYRPDQQTGPAAAEAAVKAASDGTVALLSYSPDSLEADFANARAQLTGDFLNYYNQFTEQIVAPAAQKNAVQTQAAVVNAAVSELHPDRAVVLVFLNQNTVSKENPDGSFSTSSVKVGLSKVDGNWRISAFDPV